MKKSKLSVGLVTSFIGALALSACGATSDVTAKENTIVELVGYNDSTGKIEINTDLYNELGATDEGIQLYYNAILEALIRYEYPSLGETEAKLKSITTLENEASDKVKAAIATAKQTAKDNGTSYDEEWDKILKTYKCENEAELKKHYLYELEKNELTDWYYKNNMNSLKEEYIGVNAEWKPVTSQKENVDSVFPYHVLHVLVTLSAAKDNYIRGEITQSEAKNLWSVMRGLIDGSKSFQEIAMNKSDDTGSKDKYGDVEIMSTKTAFYNEFKLGIYAYDAILSGVNKENDDTKAAYKAFGLDSEAKVVTQVTSSSITEAKVQDLIKSEMAANVKTPVANVAGIQTVPYEVFKRIGDVAEDEKIDLFSPESGATAFPRNVLYNQFLNFHSPFVVTDEDIIDNGSFDDDSVTTTSHVFDKNAPGYVDGSLALASTNFREMELPAASGSGTVTKNVLCDQEGNVIIGVRSEAGIHFMVMRKSVFKNTNLSVELAPSVTKADTSIEDYYTTYLPGEAEYPTSEYAQTFVNMIKTSDESYYAKRADTIKKEIKSTDTFDAAYDYRLFELLISNDLVKDKISFFDTDEGGVSATKVAIDEYIARLRENKHDSSIEAINKAWKDYLRMLMKQNQDRNFNKALVPTTCAFSFNKTNKDEFKEGGKCYVESK